MDEQENKGEAHRVERLMQGVSDILFVLLKDTAGVTVISPPEGKRTSQPYCFTIESESAAVPKGFTGKIYLQYHHNDGGLWTIYEMFTCDGYSRPGRIPISTRNFFDAMHTFGHWTGYSSRIHPNDI